MEAEEGQIREREEEEEEGGFLAILLGSSISHTNHVREKKGRVKRSEIKQSPEFSRSAREQKIQTFSKLIFSVW